jgi:hypothetical protein
MAWQAVVRDRLPHRGGAHPRTDRRPDPWVAVECAHAHADPLRMLVVAREDGRAAATAEPLLTPVLGVPAFQDVVTGNDAERFNRSVGARRCGGTRSTLAATAVAVARAEQLGRHLVSHRAAVAASRYRKRRHGSHCRGFAVVSTTADRVRLAPRPKSHLAGALVGCFPGYKRPGDFSCIWPAPARYARCGRRRRRASKVLLSSLAALSHPATALRLSRSLDAAAVVLRS